jgi:hypothetical protein
MITITNAAVPITSQNASAIASKYQLICQPFMCHRQIFWPSLWLKLTLRINFVHANSQEFDWSAKMSVA